MTRETMVRLSMCGAAALSALALAACGAAGPIVLPTLSPTAGASQPQGAPAGGTPGDSSSDPGATDTPTDEASPTPAGAEAPVSLTGTDSGYTDTFQLRGGDYTVNYDLAGDCAYSADLDDGSGGVVEKLFISASTGESSSTTFNGLDSGSYYVDMHTDDGGNGNSCPWGITISP